MGFTRSVLRKMEYDDSAFLFGGMLVLILPLFSGGLQPLHYKQLLALYTDVKSLGDAENEVRIDFLSLDITLRLLR